MANTMDNTLMLQGLELMIYGMGTVFVFLALLVFITMGMSALTLRLIPDKPVEAVTSRGSVSKEKNNDEHLIAVISAAIHQYRSRRK